MLGRAMRLGWSSVAAVMLGTGHQALASLPPRYCTAFVLPATTRACRTYRATPRCQTGGKIPIPHDRLEFSFTRSSGPGGQNVNKVNTRVELRFNVEEADWLPMDIRTRLANQQRHKMNKDGELVISSQEHRTQMKNRDDCIRKLEHMLAEAAIVPKVRKMRVGLTEAAKQNRLHDKKMRSQTKALRRGKSSFDD